MCLRTWMYAFLTFGACTAGLWQSFCVCVSLSVTKLTATYIYLLCESKVWCLWCSKGIICVNFSETLCSPVLASFADSKLLDFARASDSMTLHINRTLCVARYIRYVHLLTLGACALGTVAKIVNPGHHRRLPRSVHWRAFDDHGMTVHMASFQL